MILKDRPFERAKPSREAKSIFIFCEGGRREYKYFLYFQMIDSRVNIEPYKLHPHENNSPKGILDIATKCIDGDKKNNQEPKYSFWDGDEVWIVIDTDPDKCNSRTPQILEIDKVCKKRKDWFFAQSNPCFEVWLYYHFYDIKPQFDGMEICTHWKKHVNESIKGGFDSRKHPIYLEDAIKNAKKVFESNANDFPCNGSTDVFKLFERRIVNSLKSKLDQEKSLQINEHYPV